MVRSDTHALLLKQAGLQEIAKDAVKAAGQTFSEIDLKHHPFRSLFKFLGPSVLWASGHWMLAIVLGLAEEFLGGGLSSLGGMIDSMLGFGAGSVGDVSDSGLKNAAEGAMNRLLGTTMARSSAFRSSVMKRGHVAVEDIVAAWAAGPDKPLRKEALSKGMLARWWRWLRQTGSGRRMPFVAVLYKLLKSLVGGLGLYTGIKLVRKQLESPEPFGISGLKGLPFGGWSKAPSPELDPTAGMAEWRNAGGVENSIVMALDRAVRDRRGRSFSTLFAEMKGGPLRGSPAMRRVLEDISMAHGWAPIREIDQYRYFLAPPVRDLVKRLLPQMKYSPQKTRTQPATGKSADMRDIEQRLGRILGGDKQ